MIWLRNNACDVCRHCCCLLCLAPAAVAGPVSMVIVEHVAVTNLAKCVDSSLSSNTGSQCNGCGKFDQRKINAGIWSIHEHTKSYNAMLTLSLVLSLPLSVSQCYPNFDCLQFWFWWVHITRYWNYQNYQQRICWFSFNLWNLAWTCRCWIAKLGCLPY